MARRRFLALVTCASALAAVGCGHDALTPPSPESVSPEPRSGAPRAPAHPSAAPAAALGAPNVWTWLDFPSSRCANGTSTGVAVNVHPGAKHLLVFLEGGGACVDGETCWTSHAAINIVHGYGLAQLAKEELLASSFFRRDDAANAFADASYVFVPYCTGDLHAGSNVAIYDVNGTPTPTHHVGARNLDAFLAKLGPAFPSVDHVWLAGQSAGGFGALLNHDFVARAFGVRTDVIDDSGPGVGGAGYPASWNVRLPPDCPYCDTGLEALFLYDRAKYAETRFAFLSYEVDHVLPGFYGASEQDVVAWLLGFESSFARLLNTASFVVPGKGHVVTSSSTDEAVKAELAVWLQRMVSGASWTSFRATPP